MFFNSLPVQVFIRNGFSLSVNVDILLYVESKFVRDIKQEEIGYTAQMHIIFIPII